jgi:hypothetical protein
MFTPQQLKDRIRRQPFVPLRIVTSSGESYTITHPDLVLIGVRDIHVGIASRKDPTTYENVARISLLHITALEDAATDKTKKNGK